MTKSTAQVWISFLGYRPTGYLFTYSSDMCLNTYYVPVPVLGPGNIAANKTDKMWLLSWGSVSSGERYTIKPTSKLSIWTRGGCCGWNKAGWPGWGEDCSLNKGGSVYLKTALRWQGTDLNEMWEVPQNHLGGAFQAQGIASIRPQQTWACSRNSREPSTQKQRECGASGKRWGQTDDKWCLGTQRETGVIRKF